MSHEIKFLICIDKIPSVKLAIFETQFAKVSSLGNIFSQKYILLRYLTNGKVSCARENRVRSCYLHFWHAISIQYAAIMSRNRG